LTLLLWAVDNEEVDLTKKIEMCALLLQYYPNLVNQSGPDKATPLHYASGNGNIQLLNFLLEKGAKILEDDKNETPLHWACLNGHTDAVRILLQAGANPSHTSIDGNTGLHYAILNKHQHVVSLLLTDSRIDEKKRKEAREVAVMKGEKNIIQMFDPEKREILVVVQDQQKALEEHKEKIRIYEKRREADQQALETAYKTLAEEEEANRKIKEIIEQLREQARTRSMTEHELLYNEQKKVFVELQKKNADLHQQLAELSLNNSSYQRKIDVKVSDTHRNLSSLLALLDTTNIAIISVKNVLEGARKFMQVPKDEKLVI